MQSVYESLEFSKVLEKVNEYTRTDIGKNLVSNIKLFNDQNVLQLELDKLNEMMSLILRFNELPIDNSSNLLDILNYASKVGILTIQDLEKVAFDVIIANKVINKFSSLEEEFLKLKNEIEHLTNLSSIEQEIHKVISPNLTIYDDATPTLKRIRRQIVTLESDVSFKVKNLARNFQDYLSDNTVTIRNGHYVIPVKTTYKFKIEGIIHDTSDSGNTVFIEPSAIVEINNKIASLKIEEQDEISKILRRLTEIVLDKKDVVINNNAIIGYLDFLTAKAKYAINEDGVVASISDERILSLKSARHPLISKDAIVPNDFFLDTQKHIIIISGPNAGGKSVALKTVGLLTIMHQSGLPILALPSATLPFFKRIQIDIGDQQSLNDSLSTFSAHMSNIIDCTRKMGAKDLIIIDELGTGTDPQEGEALAKSLIDYIHFKHAFGIISSHFMGVKTYALDKDYVNNASMIFDEENFAPTYKMRLGIPGKSYGMEVALRLGMDKAIIDKARKYLKEDNVNLFSSSLSKLDEIVHKYETLEKENFEIKNRLEKKEKELDKLSEDLRKRKENLMREVNDEKNQIISEAHEEIEEILRSLNKEDLKMHEVINARAKLDELESVEVKHKNSNEVFYVNDFVSLDDMNLEGSITRIVGEKITVQTSIGNIVVTKDDITKISKPNKKVKNEKLTYVDRAIVSRSVPLELNIIGKHVEEAMNDVSKYLDDVVIKGYESVRIIHGSGTGALRKAVHEYLNKQKFVKSYRLGGMGEGGVGATVVYLK
ncbi:MAG: endonuclease MutS2 [Erysipelotrichales bacterium]|nr:endonuclease MutS2 [Erysipelotrichales bacterium]